MLSQGQEPLRPEDSIDPATGDFWQSSQPEYWAVAARAYREFAARPWCIHPQRQIAAAIQCEAKAAALSEASR